MNTAFVITIEPVRGTHDAKKREAAGTRFKASSGSMLLTAAVRGGGFISV
jgi:hypothetical protein